MDDARLCLLRACDGLGLPRTYYHEALQTYFRIGPSMGKSSVESKLAAILCYLAEEADERDVSQAAVSRYFVLSQSAVGEATRKLRKTLQGS